MAKKSYAILSTGRFGNHLARLLAENGQDVLVVDDSHEKLQPIEDIVNKTIVADVTDEDVLKEVGIRNFDVVVIGSAQDLERNLMATTLCKELGCEYVIAKAATELHGKMLAKLGVDRVIYPDIDSAKRLGRSLLSKSLLDYISVSDYFSIIEIVAPKEFIGKTVADLKLRNRFNVNVVLIKSIEGDIEVPERDHEMSKNDVLVIMGKNDDLTKFQKAYGIGEGI